MLKVCICKSQRVAQAEQKNIVELKVNLEICRQISGVMLNDVNYDQRKSCFFANEEDEETAASAAWTNDQL
ncbi:hypothetical protein T10_9683 [Trichinella papuae]|uniref:Uncharacterized protein n=1 Tax=Trichinella papuae TaxID=268474 RepID=A0A0V1MQG2_9BILA|nr:hypothetical protein T10_9683 [Trichinella papuae]